MKISLIMSFRLFNTLSFICFVTCFCNFFLIGSSLENGLARTPQMGWNSWNKFGHHINETVMQETAKAMVQRGLADAGYIYVNLDDCWAYSRDKNNKIVEDPTTFPSGMKSLSDYIHSLGLKFGIYSDAGLKTCAGRPGSLSYEKEDAESYASWNVDYLKYDNCYDNHTDPKGRYPVMRDALNSTGRPILFSMCEWGVEDPATWAPKVGNSWRTTGDISDHWDAVLGNLDANDKWYKYAGPGGWNDPDMLEVGNGGLSPTEDTAHFSLWALVKSPLLIGCDVRTVSDDVIKILTNKEVIDVNQDPLGVQGHKVSASEKNSLHEIWASELFDGTFAVILFNRDKVEGTLTVTWSDLDIKKSSSGYLVRDLWKHEYEGISEKEFSSSVQSHGVVMLRVFPLD